MEENPHGQSMTTEYLLSEPGIIRLDGKCQHEGCDSQGICYSYPHEEFGLDPQSDIYCALHAKSAGFCMGCGRFYGGVESFDFGDSPFCEECLIEHDTQTDYDDEEYDDDGDDYYS